MQVIHTLANGCTRNTPLVYATQPQRHFCCFGSRRFNHLADINYVNTNYETSIY